MSQNTWVFGNRGDDRGKLNQAWHRAPHQVSALRCGERHWPQTRRALPASEIRARVESETGVSSGLVGDPHHFFPLHRPGSSPTCTDTLCRAKLKGDFVSQAQEGGSHAGKRVVCLSTDWTAPPRLLTTPVHGAASQMCHPPVLQAASGWTREGVSLRRLDSRDKLYEKPLQ